MPDLTPEQQEAALLEKIPASGEIAYEDVYNALVASGNQPATRRFHAMRRAGAFVTRINEDGKLMVSKPAAQGGA